MYSSVDEGQLPTIEISMGQTIHTFQCVSGVKHETVVNFNANLSFNNTTFVTVQY